MGFWGSLVDGVKSAGGWVLDHSGDIASAVGTVAKIAGTFLLAADSGDETAKMAAHQVHLEEFHRNFDKASGLLKKRAKEEAKKAGKEAAAMRSSSAGEFATENVVKDSFTGVWKNPSALLKNGTPAVPMYQDLSKWIGTLGVPPDQSLDVAAKAGEALFANDNTNVKSGEAAIGGTKFDYTEPKGKWTLDLGHAYYPLPLGASSSEHCWHSCIYGKFHPSNSFKAEMQAEGAPRSAVFLSELKAGDKPVWVVNASINWGNATLASAVHSKLVDTLKTDYKKEGRSVLSSRLEGVMQSIQVQGGLKDNPSLLRLGLITVASKVSSDYTGPHTPDPENPSEPSSSDSSVDSSADEMNGHNGAVKNRANKPSKAKRNSTLAPTKPKPVPSDMPLNVPEVNITKSQIVFKG
ncbi:hypothetical protein FACUT_13635 [Fusarium acutatum]|uniref:Uncharacterized protein n=1 Tax=Fusarium acutatum TaxID=78861 RepID=A0A8H4JBA4_9HYPO|nr:hypothetical protein FACUT_13635 [Fusarium acutatum]